MRPSQGCMVYLYFLIYATKWRGKEVLWGLHHTLLCSPVTSPPCCIRFILPQNALSICQVQRHRTCIRIHLFAQCWIVHHMNQALSHIPTPLAAMPLNKCTIFLFHCVIGCIAWKMQDVPRNQGKYWWGVKDWVVCQWERNQWQLLKCSIKLIKDASEKQSRSIWPHNIMNGDHGWQTAKSLHQLKDFTCARELTLPPPPWVH